jgi:hypothetical protein
MLLIVNKKQSGKLKIKSNIEIIERSEDDELPK